MQRRKAGTNNNLLTLGFSLLKQTASDSEAHSSLVHNYHLQLAFSAVLWPLGQNKHSMLVDIHLQEWTILSVRLLHLPASSLAMSCNTTKSLEVQDLVFDC